MGQSVSSQSIDWNYVAPPIISNEVVNSGNDNENENEIRDNQTKNVDYTKKINNLENSLMLLKYYYANSFYKKNFDNNPIFQFIKKDLDNKECQNLAKSKFSINKANKMYSEIYKKILFNE